MENRHGLAVQTRLTQATGIAEREAALVMAARLPGRHRGTLAGDQGDDTAGFVQGCRQLRITPHAAQHSTPHPSAIDRQTTRHPDYTVSQVKRKRVEVIFGRLKTVALFRKTRHRGVARVGWQFTFATAADNLVRMRNLVKVVG